jgi:hypothetical protein
MDAFKIALRVRRRRLLRDGSRVLLGQCSSKRNIKNNSGAKVRRPSRWSLDWVRQAQPVSPYISTDGLLLQENNPKCRKFRGSVIDSEA